jgi:hypothetical protein
MLHIYIRQPQETHQTLFWKQGQGRGEWEYNGGDELVEGSLYTCIELAQWNPLILLIYANSKIKLKKMTLVKQSLASSDLFSGKSSYPEWRCLIDMAGV